MPATKTANDTRLVLDPAKVTRYQKLIRDEFQKTYGETWRNGFLGGTIVPALIRSIGYNLITGQDESIDLRTAMAHIEEAVNVFTYHPRLLA